MRKSRTKNPRVKSAAELAREALCERYEPQMPQNILWGTRDGSLAGLTPEQFEACLVVLSMTPEQRSASPEPDHNAPAGCVCPCPPCICRAGNRI